MRNSWRCLIISGILHTSFSFSVRNSLFSPKRIISLHAEEQSGTGSIFFEEPIEEVSSDPDQYPTLNQPQVSREGSSPKILQTSTPNMSQPPKANMPPSPERNLPQQPPTQRKRLDPLVAALTRDDLQGKSSNTVDLPYFGAVPVNGGLVQLAIAAIVTTIGFIYSFVVAYQSRDIFFDALAQMSNQMGDTASSQVNKVYDDGGCRGLCSTQDDSLDSMRSFMEAVTRKR